VIFAAIADWADARAYPVSFMCHQLEVSVSGYYAWRGRGPSARTHEDAKLTELIHAIFAAKHGNVGRLRMVAELAARGHRVSIKRVHRLMKAAGLRGRSPRPWRRTTIAGAKPVDAPDLIARNFTAALPNQRWCGDITYIKTWDGWAYLATVIDLHSRAVVGWAVADHMHTSLVTAALDMAIRHRKPPKGVIFHSDRGTQYTSAEFHKYCKQHQITRSLGRTGICYDNAVAESFFATYKQELIHTRPWPSIHHLRKATFEWIETYYNKTRRHSTLSYLTPREYELGYRSLDEIIGIAA
jgi:transposase InsO family protein